MLNNDKKEPPGQEVSEDRTTYGPCFGAGRKWKGHQRNNALTLLHRGFSAAQVAEILMVSLTKVQSIITKPYLPIKWRRSRLDADRKT